MFLGIPITEELLEEQLEFRIRTIRTIRTRRTILLVKTLLGLVEMMSGLANASCSLPEWQAVIMIFFAPFLLDI